MLSENVVRKLGNYTSVTLTRIFWDLGLGIFGLYLCIEIFGLGSLFWIFALGSLVWVLWFGVFCVGCFVFWILDFGFWFLDSGFWILALYRTQVSRGRRRRGMGRRCGERGMGDPRLLMIPRLHAKFPVVGRRGRAFVVMVGWKS